MTVSADIYTTKVRDDHPKLLERSLHTTALLSGPATVQPLDYTRFLKERQEATPEQACPTG
jgi:hypothetical protein